MTLTQFHLVYPEYIQTNWPEYKDTDNDDFS